jgi:CubicO group peptidase (beta-lactamase class C family)
MSQFATLPRSEAEEVGLSSERLLALTQAMGKAVKEGAIPGVATVVARHGHVVHTDAQGYLDIERRTPLGLDSIFRMYSQTKPVTAVLIMQLHEDGVLLLDEPVSKYLPEFASRQVARFARPEERVRGIAAVGVDTVPAYREITLFDLLTMTSGLPSFFRTPAFLYPLVERGWAGTGFLQDDSRPINDPVGSYEDLVLALAALPLHSQPGETWQYGSDFDLLTLVIERATGRPLDQMMRERIFDPLGMNDSSFYCDAGDLDRLVTEYQWDEKGEIAVRDRPETTEKAAGKERRLVSGNGVFGGMLSTPADWTRFAQMLLNKGSLDGIRILGRKSVELMTANHIGDRQVDIVVGPGYGFGFGYAVRKSIAGSFLPGSIGTFGWGGAAGTWFFVDPVEDLFGLFFTHVFGYQFSPTADLFLRFEKMTYEALL